MIYFFYSTDRAKGRAKARKLFDNLKAKKPDASFIELNEESVVDVSLLELVGNQGLFERKIVVFLKDVLQSEKKEEILKFIKDLAKSENIFIWSESDLLALEIKKIESNSEKADIEKKELKEKKEAWSTFTLADALGRRDKKELWKLYTKAVMLGKSAEEIHGIIFWQVKSILQAFGANSAEAAGLKPYPFTKAKQFSKNFKEEELKNKLMSLTEIYHEAHRGEKNFEIEMEKFVLSI